MKLTKILIVFIAVEVVVLGGAVYLKSSNKNQTESTNSNSQSSTSSTGEITKTDFEYEKYTGKAPIEFEYPKDWTIEEHDQSSYRSSGTLLDIKVVISSPDFALFSEGTDTQRQMAKTGQMFVVTYDAASLANAYVNKLEDLRYLLEESYSNVSTITTLKGIQMLQGVTTAQEFKDYVKTHENLTINNSAASSYYSGNKFIVYFDYHYPDRDDKQMDPAAYVAYQHMLDTFSLK